MNAHTDPATTTVTEPKAYRVDWAVNLNATSALEAACFASDIQDEFNTATIFSVTDMQTGEITVHDVGLDGIVGTNIAAKRPEQKDHVRRTLRPGRTYQTRNGLPVEITHWDEPGEFPLGVRMHSERDGVDFVGLRAKDGSHPQGGEHPLDVFEVSDTITKWVRMYDAKLTPEGKQIVNGKEFAGNRGLFMYLFDTEEEAKASKQGVRAIFPIEYREGDGCG